MLLGVYVISINRFSLFGKHSERGAAEKKEASGSSVSFQLREEFVKLALRDAIIRHSVPRNWIGVELLPVDSPAGGRWDVRLIVRERNGLLWTHATDFRATFIRRLRLLDSQWAKWVADVSWQFPLGVAHGGVVPTMAGSPANSVPETSAGMASDPSSLKIAGIYPGVLVAGAHGTDESRSQTPSPQQIQLQKLREVMSQGDSVLKNLESSGQLVEFQDTRPFQS